METKTLAIGSDVKVVGLRGKGEKAPKGTVGRVFWMRENEYVNPYTGDVSVTLRVGFETVDGKRFFTPASNLALVEPKCPTQYAQTAHENLDCNCTSQVSAPAPFELLNTAEVPF